MMNGIKVVVLVAIAFMGIAQDSTCSDPNYIIPYESLDQAFDQGINAVRSQQNLVTLIENPNEENVRNYLLSLAPFSAALFAFAGVSFVLMVAMIIQIICYNTCSKDCCGNEINSSTYNVCCMRTMVYTFLILSFLLVGLSIGSLIVNSDLQRAVDYTSCNTQNIVDEAYNGNTNTTIPWSGVNNFGNDIDVFAVNIQNVVPNLVQYFSTSNSLYNDTIDISSTTTAYNKSQTYDCENASGLTIDCPFAPSSTCPSPYEAEFTLNFCDVDVSGSSQNLISSEMQTNSTTWRENIIGIGQSLSNIQLDQNNIDTLVNEINSFTTSVADYEDTLNNGLSDAENVNYAIQIALYVFLSFLLVLGLAGFTSVCCVYYCKTYSCNCMTYVWCISYSLLAILIFVAAGLFLSGSIFTYDGCSAYPYYFQNKTNFNSLTFANQNTGDIFQTCFFTNSTSMFTAFDDSSILTQFTTLQSEYKLAVPSTSFTTVVTTIESTLFNYNLNPQTITIANVNTNQQPQAALDDANVFANYSSTGSDQSCNVTKDKLTFNVASCYPYLTDQAPGQNTCVVVSTTENISQVITNRTDTFTQQSCSTQGTTYEDNANALLAYRTSINAIVNSIVSVTDNPTNPLQEYEDNYFSYYSNVQNFFNSQVQTLFSSFFTPYDSLYDGSSCGFITASMDGIVNIGCNQLFPYFNTLSILMIVISVVVFFLMILAYFLTTRFHFYEFLEGDFENYGVQTLKTDQLPGNNPNYGYEMDSTNRNQNLMKGY